MKSPAIVPILAAALACLLVTPPVMAQGAYPSGQHPQPDVPSDLLGRSSRAAPLGANEFSVASSAPWSAPTGTHFHSDDGGSFGNPPDLMEVGACCGGFSGEEDRGMCEFDLAGQTSAAGAMLSFEVLQLSGLFAQPGGTFDIVVETYLGNNVEELADYSAAATATLGTFSTGGLSVSDIVSFDITSAYNAAIANSDPALGVLLRASTNPDGAALVFGNCAIAPTMPTLPGPWLALLVLALLATAAMTLRSRAHRA